MHKYWAFYKIGFTRMSVYRGPLLIWAVCSCLSLITIVAVWFASATHGTIAGYSKNQLITYAILGVLMGGLLNWNPFPGVKSRIKDGTIAGKTLTKPYSYFLERIMWELSWKSYAIFFNLAVVVIATIFLYKNLVLAPMQISSVILLIAIIGACLLQFTFAFCLALLTFWFTETDAIGSTRFLCMTLLGGSSIPIAFIPASYQGIVRLLPFRYMYSLPMEIMLNKVPGSEVLIDLIIQYGWLLIFILLYKLMWNNGLKRYVSVGQ